MNIIKAGLVDVINYVLIRSSSWSPEQAANPDVRPTSISWTAELCNATGMLRNVSSAGEEARLSLRSARSLVDALLWIMRGAIGTDEASNKVCVCVCAHAHVGVGGCGCGCGCVHVCECVWVRLHLCASVRVCVCVCVCVCTLL